MVKVRSRVYVNQSINFNAGSIKFVNGSAEISDEIYQEIIDRKFPNIYKEDEIPEYKTPLENQLRKEVKEGNKEFEDEIARLKNIIQAKQVEIDKKDGEIAAWKKVAEDLKKVKSAPIQEAPEVTKSPEQEESLESQDKELLKELQGMKKEELIELAKKEEGGSYLDEDLKDKKKDEIISMIISKA